MLPLVSPHCQGDRFQTKLLDFDIPRGVHELDEKVELKIPSTEKPISPKPYADLAAVKIYIRKGQAPPPGSFCVRHVGGSIYCQVQSLLCIILH